MQDTTLCFLPPRPSAPAIPLSRRLRLETEEVHAAIEAKLGLPQTIGSLGDYLAYLRRSYRLYRPLHDRLLAFPDWADHGISLGSQNQVACLASDLAILQPGVSLPTVAPAEALPDLCSFPHAVGALYVLKGSMSGGEIILRHLLQASVTGVASACAFLGAGRMQGGTTWQAFRTQLDQYGWDQPEAAGQVVVGALRSFQAIGNWMQSTRWTET